MDQAHIRNFAIIAHIDHGKSTLADRLLELTETIERRDMREQILDSNPIERERGITIKLAPVRMQFKRFTNDDLGIMNKYKNELINHKSNLINQSDEYVLNLIDTPGHVDFNYEVSRSLAACEGAILVVDATQGVQAQTLANLHLARMHSLTIIPVINKIDLPNANIEETEKEIHDLGFTIQEILKISAKTGENVESVLEGVIERIPPPSGHPEGPLRALVFSSQYDAHKGVVVFVRLVDGSIYYDSDTNIKFLVTNAEVHPIEVGYFSPQMIRSDKLLTGEVGFIATGLKDIRFAKVGDTITISKIKDQKSKINIKNQKEEDADTVLPLPGYHEPKPMVFVGLFPITADEFSDAREAMEKLRLSDSAFSFRPISSLALGNGFHCGFLGLLHAEIVQERLFREFNLAMIATTPSVEYQISLRPRLARLQSEALRNTISIQSASEFPDPSFIDEVKEPVMEVRIFTPKRYIGAVMQLAEEKRAEYIDLKYISEQAEFTYLMPLSEMIIDFFDRLKSISEGYASLDYEFLEFQKVDVAKVDILVNKEKVDALSMLIVADNAQRRGREIVERLSEVIPRQQFTIPIQAAIGGNIIARADVKSFRKDVTKKLYGGDRTRKDKLLDKQKKGKARMKRVGMVEIPQSAFFEVLKRG